MRKRVAQAGKGNVQVECRVANALGVTNRLVATWGQQLRDHTQAGRSAETDVDRRHGRVGRAAGCCAVHAHAESRLRPSPDHTSLQGGTIVAEGPEIRKAVLKELYEIRMDLIHTIGPSVRNAAENDIVLKNDPEKQAEIQRLVWGLQIIYYFSFLQSHIDKNQWQAIKNYLGTQRG